jgi:hypothetical protein
METRYPLQNMCEHATPAKPFRTLRLTRLHAFYTHEHRNQGLISVVPHDKSDERESKSGYLGNRRNCEFQQTNYYMFRSGAVG